MNFLNSYGVKDDPSLYLKILKKVNDHCRANDCLVCRYSHHGGRCHIVREGMPEKIKAPFRWVFPNAWNLGQVKVEPDDFIMPSLSEIKSALENLTEEEINNIMT